MNALTLPLTNAQALPNISEHPFQFRPSHAGKPWHSYAENTRGDGGYESGRATKSSTPVAGLNTAGASRERKNEEVGNFLSAQFALKMHAVPVPREPSGSGSARCADTVVTALRSR